MENIQKHRKYSKTQKNIEKTQNTDLKNQKMQKNIESNFGNIEKCKKYIVMY